MKWFKYGLAALLLILSFPFWRLQDWAVVILPFPTLITALMVIWSGIFISLPLLLLLPRMKGWMGFLIMLLVGVSVWFSGPLSNQATLDPSLDHCGRLTYTGFFYPARNVLSPAHLDDLEVRNQMCWMLKMIKKVPDTIATEELPLQLVLLKTKLSKPHFKFRASLPWLMLLVSRYFSATEVSNNPLVKYQDSRLFVDNFKYWSQTYNESVSAREYAWYEWPHSQLIKAEYGFIEENWDKIEVQSL